MKRFLLLSNGLLALIALSACSLSLAQDVPPPPGYQPPVYEEPEILTGAAPQVLPNPENGSLIYAQKCEACHGITGLGDGPDSTALPNEVARIGAANIANLASPLEWYSITLQGNIDNFMPPFEGSLSPADVWDVLSYIYTFSASPGAISQGEEVFANTCAACHGADGSGSDVPGAANFQDAERMVLLSVNDIVQKAATGNGNQDHVFSTQLDAAEIEAVALYVRSLNFPLEGEVVEELADQPAAGEPGADQAEESGEPAVEEGTGEEPLVGEPGEELATVVGLVTNGSGGELPAGLEVQLEVYQSFELVYSDSVLANPDGRYQFEDVLLDPELIYITLVETDNAFFPSAFHLGDQTVGETIDLPITIYDGTTETSALAVSRLHAFFQFTDQGTVQIIHQVSISNRGNQMVAPQRDTEPVLSFTLPEGATNLIFQNGVIGNPYVQTTNGFADPTPVIPGENSYEILFAYEMPFDRKLEWQLPLDLPTDVAVIFVEGESLKLDSETLLPSGTEAIDQGVFQVLIANELAAGQTIDLQLSTPLLSGGDTFAQNNWITILLGVVGLGLAGFGAWRFFVPVSDEERDLEEDQDQLIDVIIALDEKFEAGLIDEEPYLKEREALKSQLQALLDEGDIA
ncbi:MAG: c-type cytochrome [Anaerolineales bacterium]|nr:c-type cytochrome [Anaerolineales bacterium]